MGQVVDFHAWRRRRLGRGAQPARPAHPTIAGTAVDETAGDVSRLDAAVRRIERAMASGRRRISTRVETELLAITGAVSAGRTEDAATRAERLAERLEHPSSRLSG